MTIYPIKLANVPTFWIKTDASVDDINDFVAYFEVLRSDNGNIAPVNTEQKAAQLDTFIEEINKQYKVQIYARTDIGFKLKENERSAKWLYRQFCKKKKILYSTVTLWVNGTEKPNSINRAIIDQIIRSLL